MIEASERTPFQEWVRTLLQGVADGNLTVEDASTHLKNLAFSDLGFAKVDHHRELRQGACEIVYADGKTPQQVAAVAESLLSGNDGPVLVTRAGPEHRSAVRQLAERASFNIREEVDSRALAILRNVPARRGQVLVLTGGTADLPVAKEAELTASVLGTAVELHADVGVAGLHRITALRDRLRWADVVVVVAGMEGALASVVGGLVASPVIACPSSAGYGASFGGLAALLSMLSSCAPGVVCVNIDDGVGAGYTAALIARGPAFRESGS